MKVAIIKYNAGNVRSVAYALDRIGVSSIVTNEPFELLSADKIIFPGVGEASSAMSYLKENGLDRLIIGLKQPVLGICLGMQLMCRYSEEGNTKGLGIFDQDVRRFPDDRKVPQIGWNSVSGFNGPLFKNVNEDEYLYFVHSYFAGESPYSIATADYGGRYSAGLRKGNFYGVQFHPEKSGAAGEQILKNFIELAI